MFDDTYLRIFARSFVQAGLTTAICVALGLPMAWYMATRGPRTAGAGAPPPGGGRPACR